MRASQNFETVTKLWRDEHSLVARVRPAGSKGKATLTLKQYRLRKPSYFDAQDEATLTYSDEAFALECRKRIEVQKHAGKSSSHVARISESSEDGCENWYVTKFYPLSAAKILNANFRLTERAFIRLIRGATRGALDLKRSCNRSHGNLKPENILVSNYRLAKARVLVSDPAPGGAKDAQTLERKDLQALGRLMLSLVLRKPLTEEQATALFPEIRKQAAWGEVCGKNADAWATLCATLLDPKLDSRTFGLEQLWKKVQSLTPLPVGAIVKGIVSVAFLAGIAAVFLRPPLSPKNGVVNIVTKPEGANISVNGEKKGKVTSIALTNGTYSLQAEYPEYPGLGSILTNGFTVKAGETSHWEISFACVELLVKVIPTDALITMTDPRGTILKKNAAANGVFRSGYLKPNTAVDLSVEKNPQDTNSYSSKDILSYIVSDTNNTLNIQLTNRVTTTTGPGEPIDLALMLYPKPTKETAGNWQQLDYQIKMGEVVLTNDLVATRGIAEVTFPAEKKGMKVLIEVSLRHGRAQWDKWSTNYVIGSSDKLRVDLPFVSLNIDSLPPRAEVTMAGDLLLGATPIKDVPWPSDRLLNLNYKLDGYHPTTITTNLPHNGTVNLSASLKAMAGFLQFSSDLFPVTIDDGKGTQYYLASGSPTNFQRNAGSLTLEAEYQGWYAGAKPKKQTTTLVSRAGETAAWNIKFLHGKIKLEPGSPNIQLELNDGVVTNGTALLVVGDSNSFPVIISQDGYERITNQFAAVMGQTQTITLPKLVERKVLVAIETDPPNGQVYDDEKNAWVPVKQLAKLRWGRRALRFQHPQYELPEAQQTYDVKSSGTNELTFKFQYAKVAVQSTQSGVSLWLNGTNKLSLPQPEIIQPIAVNLTYKFERNGVASSVSCRWDKPPYVLTAPAFSESKLLKSWQNSADIRLGWIPNGPGGANWPGNKYIPAHAETGFYVGQSEVTQAQYQKVTGKNPSKWKDRGDYPVSNVSWTDAKAFCEALTALDRTAGVIPDDWSYALPTFNQWRAFMGDLWPNFPSKASVRLDLVVCNTSATPVTQYSPVGSKGENSFGLYDVLGNVSEWRWDCVDGQPYAIGCSYEAAPASPFLELSYESTSVATNVVGLRVLLLPTKNITPK
ncbi:MAG: SUMF1/EgtB/PvdO family nonheme iron enzyme [Verrucomicrobiota bacterium]